MGRNARLGAAIAVFVAIAATGAWGVSAADTITTFAGTGQRGFGGDGGPATSAALSLGQLGAQLAVDAQGDLFIADMGNHRIRKIDAGGRITTVAGNGTAGYSGDGGPATAAQLFNPIGVAVSPQGTLFIADYGNGRVRAVSPAGTITTVAGGGVLHTDGILAISANVAPIGLATDAGGNVLFTDGARVRRVVNGTISTIAGSTAGNAGDGGPATAAKLFSPWAIAFGPQGSLYIADRDSSRIRKVDVNGIISTIAGGGVSTNDAIPATAANIGQPIGLAVDPSGNVYVSTGTVRRVAPDGTITTVIRSGLPVAGGTPAPGDGGPAVSGTVNFPVGLAVDAAARLYIADGGNDRIRRIAPGSAPAASPVAVGGSTTQALGAGGVTVTGTCATACTLTGTGTVTAPGSSATIHLTPAHATLTTAGRKPLHLRMSAAARKRLGRLLRGGRRARATITVLVVDSAGRRSSARFVVTIVLRVSSARRVAPAAASGSLATFVGRLEVMLRRSATDRTQIGGALGAVLGCSATPSAAAARVTGVASDRQGLLQELGGLGRPTAAAARMATLLQGALAHSVLADRRYQAWLAALGAGGCPRPRTADYAAAQREDVIATAAKRGFVAAFNPVARGLGLRTWSADAF